MTHDHPAPGPGDVAHPLDLGGFDASMLQSLPATVLVEAVRRALRPRDTDGGFVLYQRDTAA